LNDIKNKTNNFFWSPRESVGARTGLEILGQSSEGGLTWTARAARAGGFLNGLRVLFKEKMGKMSHDLPKIIKISIHDSRCDIIGHQ
jgi:hypothetical protein